MNKLKNVFSLARTKLGRFLLLLACAILIASIAILGANRLCQGAASGLIYHSVENVPQNDVGLVLGTSKTIRHGRANLHFNQRIDAAVALYRAGKVRHLLVSGDNHLANYDEPTDMRDALVAAGIPAEAITCDYAGFRTLDSVVRAQQVFGLTRCVIVTEDFHCPRALWIAREHGLNAVAFAAPDVPSAGWSFRVKTREIFARVWCGVDLYVLHRQPHFTGPPEPIVLGAKPAATRQAPLAV